MIVCLCVGITDKRIRELAEDGATSAEEVGRRCRAGTDCGACVPTIASLVSEADECACPSTGRKSGFPEALAHEGT